MRDHLNPCQKPSYRRFLSTRDADVVDSSAPESLCLSKREMAKARAVMHASNVLHRRSQDCRAVLLMLAGSHRAFAVATSPRRLRILSDNRTPTSHTWTTKLARASCAGLLRRSAASVQTSAAARPFASTASYQWEEAATVAPTRTKERYALAEAKHGVCELHGHGIVVCRLPPNILLLNESGWSFATVDLVVTRDMYRVN